MLLVDKISDNENSISGSKSKALEYMYQMVASVFTGNYVPTKFAYQNKTNTVLQAHKITWK
jgi:hypothetical protein